MTEWKEQTLLSHDFSEQPEIIGKLVGKTPSTFSGNDYVLKLENGSEVTIFGKTVLQTKLEKVEIGTLVKIVYKGKVKSSKNPRYEYDDFAVYTAKE